MACTVALLVYNWGYKIDAFWGGSTLLGLITRLMKPAKSCKMFACAVVTNPIALELLL